MPATHTHTHVTFDIRERISGLHASYGTWRGRPTSFPDWCNDEAYQKLHDKFCQTARLVAPQNEKDQARLSIYQRQPVNIAMGISGTNPEAFEQSQKNLWLGGVGKHWNESYYTTHYMTYKQLAVNVVHCVL